MPGTPEQRIDEAIASAEQAAHACRSPLARKHLEYALALLRESWITECHQEGKNPGEVIAEVREGLDLVAAVFSKKGAN